MKIQPLKLQKETYGILFICLLLINISLSLTLFHTHATGADADTRRWIALHGAYITDTVCASLSLTFGGAFAYEYTYKKEKK